MRDSVAFNHFMTEYGQGRDMQEMMRWWAQHPYTPEVQGGLPRNLSDDPGWDPHFPGTPSPGPAASWPPCPPPSNSTPTSKRPHPSTPDHARRVP